MDKIVIVRHVTKTIEGKMLLDDVSLEIEKGTIAGIIGRNGSGKTVLLKCICGFMKPSEGEIIVHGEQIGKGVKLASDIGVMIESPGFLDRYSGYRNLKFLAGIQHTIGKQEIRKYMEMMGLDPDSKKPVKNYSVGMKQRLGIAQAVMEDQDLLILDEPMNGLDSTGVTEIRKLLLKLKEQGKTILITSHIKEDIDILCERVYCMSAGKLNEVEI